MGPRSAVGIGSQGMVGTMGILGMGLTVADNIDWGNCSGMGTVAHCRRFVVAVVRLPPVPMAFDFLARSYCSARSIGASGCREQNCCCCCSVTGTVLHSRHSIDLDCRSRSNLLDY